MQPLRLQVDLALSGTTSYRADRPFGADSWPEPAAKVGPVAIEIQSEPLGSGRVLSMRISNAQRSHLVIRRVGISFATIAERVLEAGYQSWSPVRICRPDDPVPLRRIQPLMARGCYHADPGFAGRVVSSDQYMIWHSGETGGAACFLDAKHHLSTVTCRADGSEVTAWAILDRIVLEPGESFELEPLWVSKGVPGELYSELAGHWGQRADGRLAKDPPVSLSRPGWCSWYQYFWRISPAELRRDLAIAREHGVGLMVLDDGYASRIGDWLEPNERWSKTGSTPWDLAEEIEQAGLMPGIWTAPFFAAARSKVASNHPEWIVRARMGALPQPLFFNPVAWGGLVYALDTTQPAVLDHIRETFSSLVDRGFRYHKIDFCYAATMPGRRSADGRMTRAQALASGLQAVRDGIGESSYLLGCGCPFGPAVGIVDAMRVSPDVAPWWAPNLLRWPAYAQSAPAALNAVRASLLRAPLHRRLFVNDPDCLILRPRKTRLDPAQRRTLAETVAGTGGFAVLSDDLSLYGEEEWKLLDNLAKLAGKADGPLDIDDPFASPVSVSSPGIRLTVDWDLPNSRLD